MAAPTEIDPENNGFFRRIAAASVKTAEEHVAVIIAVLAVLIALFSALLVMLSLSYAAALHWYVGDLKDGFQREIDEMHDDFTSQVGIVEIRERNNRAKLDTVLELYGMPPQPEETK